MAKWWQESGLANLAAQVEAAGGELRIVGGAVRDHVMGRTPKEIDAATTLTPDAMTKVGEACGYKVVPTGINHGTVTVVLPERTLEVTTLRRDTACDGRHADVEYTTSWEEDAARRDFTINALYMDRRGNIYDYHNGKNDITTGTVRFIGDAEQRIEEDGLRILRFYRFLATHGHAPADANALVACKLKRGMIAALSGERVAQEMRKLLAAPDALYSLEQMQKAEIDQLVLHAPLQLVSLPTLMACETREHMAPEWTVRLLAITDVARADAVVAYVMERWKLSNKEGEALRVLAKSPLFNNEDTALTHKKYLRAQGRPAYIRLLLLSAGNGLLADIGPWVKLANTWVPPTFPVTSQSVMARGFTGKALGDALKTLEMKWEDSDYSLSAEALLKTIT